MSPSTTSAKFYLWLLALAPLLELLAHAERVADSDVCEKPVLICAVSSNQPTSKENDVDSLAKLTQECKQGTGVVALMIQDYPDNELPETLGKFSRRGAYRLSELSARGKTCKGEAAPTNCGTVWVAVYALSGVSLDHSAHEAIASAGGNTKTTAKGTVAVGLGINGKTLVVASTHGTEGVRAKKPEDEKKPCPGDPSEAEWQRVQDFRNALSAIAKLQQTTRKPGKPEVGVLWGGDFNPRTVWPEGTQRKGCPMWPGTGVDLTKMQGSRDILGSDKAGNLVTFSQMIKASKLVEADTSACPCPTYKKDEKDKTGFSCTDPGKAAMHYLSTHPPSWTDRIFHSADADWLQCDGLQRIRKDADHDAVALSCKVCQ